MSTVAKTEFEKSLARLESMTKSQLFHTASDSNPKTWAGSSETDEDSMDDSIQENGTDYDGVKKSLAAKVSASKALTPAEVKIVKGQNPYTDIAIKVNKGLALTKAESWALKGGRKFFAKSDEMANSPKKDGAAEENKTARDIPSLNVADKNDGKKDAEADPGTSKGFPFDKDEDDDKAEKSLANGIAGHRQLREGIEMSPILHQFAAAMGHALEGQEARVVKSVTRALAPLFARIEGVEKSVNGFMSGQDEFNKSMGEAVVGIGQQIAGSGEVANAANSLPVGPPRSQLRSIAGGGQGGISPVAKSFGGPGGLEDGAGAMAKSQIVNVMTDMVKSGKLNPLEVVKYESTGELTQAVSQAVLSHAQGGGR
jgi:hypothetical protein